MMPVAKGLPTLQLEALLVLTGSYGIDFGNGTSARQISPDENVTTDPEHLVDHCRESRGVWRV